MTKIFRIPAGSRIQLGAPARPLPQEVREKFAAYLRSVTEIVEAHLPLCQVPETMVSPAQVLVLVFAETSDPESLMPEITGQIETILPEDLDLDVWPLEPRSKVLDVVRSVKCQLIP